MSMGSMQKYAFPMVLVVILGWLLGPRILSNDPLQNKFIYITVLVTVVLVTVFAIASLESLDAQIWRKNSQG